MSSICAFCLSKDRNLSYINNQQLFYVYYALNTEDAQYVKHLQTECLLQVCWECTAKLRNFSVFVQTVEQGVHTLRNYLEHPSEVLPPSLSKLFISEVLTLDDHQRHHDETDSLATPAKVEGFGTACGVKLEVELTQIVKETKDPASSIKAEDNFDDDNYMVVDDLLPYPSEGDSRDAVDASNLPDSTERQRKPKTKMKTTTKPKRKKRPPSEPKCTVQWASNEQAQAWYTNEREQETAASPSNTHLCDKCQRGFAGEQELQAHVELRHSEAAGKYTCNMCQYRFPDQSLLKHHIESHYLLYKCKKCSYEIRTLSLMQTHSKTEHSDLKVKRRTLEERTKDNEKAQKCKRCKNVFANMTSLRKHRAKCSTYKCEHCDKSFKYNPSYYEHLKTHREDAEETLIYCAGCETHFKSAKWYKQHFFKSLKHVTRDAFKHECQHCGMKFLTPRRLREHVGSIHLKKGIYQCEMCPKSYMSKGMFARHRASKHNLGLVNKTRDKICDVCGKAFTSNHLLNNHMRSHTGEKPFQCSFCPATFAQSGTLYTHTKVVHNKRISKQGATDTERYRCSVCNKEFGTDAKRRAHFDYYHLKNSKFACTVCDKNFISSTSLKNHNATRHGLATSRSYSCEHCGKKFTTASARCQHLKTHSSERSLQCRACDATFRNTGALYMHYKLKHLKLKRGDRVRIKNLCKSTEEIIVNRDP